MDGIAFYILYFLSGHCYSCGRNALIYGIFIFIFLDCVAPTALPAMWVTGDHSIVFVVAIG